MTKKPSMVMNLQSIIDQHTATIQQLQERIDGDAVKYNQKCQYCEKLERELAIEKSKNQVHQDYMDALSRKGPLVSLNVSGNVDISKDAPDVGRIKTPVEPSKAIATTNPPPPTIESFFDRVKSIIQLAASKNGQTIRCKAKGHISFYTFFINADCLCRAVDEMVEKFPDLDIIFIESGGDNLSATFSPELSDATIFVIDVAEGDKIPRKGGPGITRSDLLVINKIDLAPYVGASLEVMERDSKKMRGERPFVFTNIRAVEGVDKIVNWIKNDVLLEGLK